MPFYDYKCPKCEHAFSKLVKMSDSQLPQECPACKEPEAQRQVSAPQGLQFKGGGYYVTDFR